MAVYLDYIPYKIRINLFNCPNISNKYVNIIRIPSGSRLLQNRPFYS